MTNSHMQNQQKNVFLLVMTPKLVLNTQSLYEHCEQCSGTVFKNTFVLIIQKQLSGNCPEVLSRHLILTLACDCFRFFAACCSSFKAQYESQKACKIRRNNQEIWCKPLRSFSSSMHMLKKCRPDPQNKHINVFCLAQQKPPPPPQ